MDGRQFKTLQAKTFMQISQLMAGLVATLQPLRDDRPAVAAFPFNFGATPFGHRAHDPWMIQSVHDPDRFQVFLITPSLTPALREAPLGTATRKAHLVELDQFHSTMVQFFQSPFAAPLALEISNLKILGHSFWRLQEAMATHQRKSDFLFKAELNDQEKEKFHCVAREGGLDPDAPFAVFHAREKGYKDVDAEHVTRVVRVDEQINYKRNADIDTLIPAMLALRDRGYQIVRIGDRTMKRLPKDLGDGIFDWADAGTIDQVATVDRPGRGIETQLIAKSRFVVASASGPASISHLFDTPMLIHNYVPTGIAFSTSNTWLSFAKIVRAGSNKALSFQELHEDKILDIWNANILKQRGYEIVHHSPDMITDLCLALARKVEGELPSEDIEPTSRIFREQAMRFDQERRSHGLDPFLASMVTTVDDAIARTPLYFANRTLNLPRVYLDHVEGFLG